MAAKGKVRGVRVDDETEKGLAAFEADTSIEAISLMRAATHAALAFYEKHGYLSFPLVIVPVEERAKVNHTVPTAPPATRASHQQRRASDPSQATPLPIDAQAHRSHLKRPKIVSHDPLPVIPVFKL